MFWQEEHSVKEIRGHYGQCAAFAMVPIVIYCGMDSLLSRGKLDGEDSPFFMIVTKDMFQSSIGPSIYAGHFGTQSFL